MNNHHLEILVLATVDSSHFEFQALARSRAQAEKALLAAWVNHRRDYPGAQVDLMQRWIDDGEAQFHEIAVGGVLRDGETIL